MAKRAFSSIDSSSGGHGSAAAERIFRAIQRDALARGVHPDDATRQRAAEAFEAAEASIPGLTHATAEVLRDEGIELRIETANAIGIVSIDPSAEPHFEVTCVRGDEYGDDVAFSDLSEAIGYLAAQLS
ncbi:MAG TPA: hypothetical protein VN697_03990 [Tepidiformaceae bacterium]|nr:hypothetical protein [Tepidiformaceae bacterium]